MIQNRMIATLKARQEKDTENERKRKKEEKEKEVAEHVIDSVCG